MTLAYLQDYYNNTPEFKNRTLEGLKQFILNCAFSIKEQYFVENYLKNQNLKENTGFIVILFDCHTHKFSHIPIVWKENMGIVSPNNLETSRYLLVSIIS